MVQMIDRAAAMEGRNCVTLPTTTPIDTASTPFFTVSWGKDILVIFRVAVGRLETERSRKVFFPSSIFEFP